jgi:hypothetical protein
MPHSSVCSRIIAIISLALMLCGTTWAGSNQPFLTGNSYPTGKYPDAIATGDFNQDGHPDVAVANRQFGTVTIYLGKSNGTFSPVVKTYQVTGAPRSIAVADVNGDGKLDLVVVGGSGAGGSINVLWGNGDGTFQAATVYSVSATLFAVTAVDLNGDGHPDIAAVSGLRTQKGGLWVLLNNGNGTFQTPTSPALTGAFTQVDAGDFNRDGKMDLLLMSESSVSLVLGHGNGAFQAATVVSTVPYTTLTVADFNGDGKLDFAGTQSLGFGTDDAAMVQLGNGDGTFEPAITTSTQSFGGVAVIAGDLNGDGLPDLIAVNQNSNDLSVLISKGNGTFAGAVTYSTPAFPSAVAAADFNGDHKLDLAVVGVTNTLTVVLGKGDGTLEAARDYQQGDPTDFNFTDQPAFGDLNRDGKVDIVVPTVQGAAVYLNLGAGIFSGPVYYEPATGSAALGDVNGDGILDLVTISNGVHILLGNGDGTFQAPVTYGFSGLENAVALGDFNGDGKLDIAGVQLGLATVSILLGNGDGTFQAPVVYATKQSNNSEILVADLNHDGKLDLYLTGFNSAPIPGEVLLGRGDGTFRPATYTGDNGGMCAVLGDFNHDGNLDIAVAPWETQIQVVLGKGNGTFMSPVNYPIPGAARCLAAGDFNGDGQLDLAVSVDDYAVNLLYGRANGTFTNAGSFQTGQGWGIGAYDLNGDGWTDLAIITEGGSGRLVVALNGNGADANQAASLTWTK